MLGVEFGVELLLFIGVLMLGVVFFKGVWGVDIVVVVIIFIVNLFMIGEVCLVGLLVDIGRYCDISNEYCWMVVVCI